MRRIAHKALVVGGVFVISSFLLANRKPARVWKIDSEFNAPKAAISIQRGVSQEAFGNNYFEHAIVAGKRRATRGYLTIGIPTVRRPKNYSYLHQTLDSLIQQANEDDRREMTLVILLADFDEMARSEVNNTLFEKYFTYISDGFIQVIEAPREFYPSFTNIPRMHKHSPLKVQWRSKQCYDYAFIMLYSANISEFYMQLEDDVEAVPGYMGIIRKFISSRKGPWTCLEFSSLGFIAKLYHSFDIEKLARLLMLFFYEQPNDVLYLFFNEIKNQEHRIVRKPTIFKHLGIKSSLSEKEERRIDPLFMDESKANETSAPTTTVLNPPAKFISTFGKAVAGTPQDCYNRKQVWWTYGPSTGTTLTIQFDKPEHIYSVTVVTGTADHPDDFLQQALLIIGQRVEVKGGQVAACTDAFAVTKFELGKAHIQLDQTLQELSAACVQVSVLLKQMNWIQMSEISIRVIQAN